MPSSTEIPETRWARSGALNIACQVVGDGSVELVFCPPFPANVELVWEVPPPRTLTEGSPRLPG